ncbi:cell wall hydrolase [Pantoea sp. B9002]|uniref:cell wall hydrolase n=1 Tax=Pantoea sp. B9002 TaxID=2726979 RepID=UPI0015A069B1|nr:cell wall hydrolase [Pantoea sp. B9002]NWA64153.1 cell wall hydrolase [Pantoea sp. B9002]
MLIKAATLCLALNIYHEARGEPELGQVAVGTVTMNRANWDVKEICPVVYAPSQFSWTAQIKTTEHYPHHKNKSWQRAQKLAQRIIQGEQQDVTNGATFFHAQRVTPYWVASFERTVSIGNHIFYANK